MTITIIIIIIITNKKAKANVTTPTCTYPPTKDKNEFSSMSQEGEDLCGIKASLT
jgi:hypothetical protein